MDTIIARSRNRMWTAFRTGSGAPMLNVSADPGNLSSTITIALEEDDVLHISDFRTACMRVDELLESGRRVVSGLPTPALRPREPYSAIAA